MNGKKRLGSHRTRKPRVKRPEHFRYCGVCGRPVNCRCGERQDHDGGVCGECQ